MRPCAAFAATPTIGRDAHGDSRDRRIRAPSAVRERTGPQCEASITLAMICGNAASGLRKPTAFLAAQAPDPVARRSARASWPVPNASKAAGGTIATSAATITSIETHLGQRAWAFVPAGSGDRLDAARLVRMNTAKPKRRATARADRARSRQRRRRRSAQRPAARARTAARRTRQRRSAANRYALRRRSAQSRDEIAGDRIRPLRATPNCIAFRISRSSAAHRARPNCSSARRRSATPRSRSPTNARWPASCARSKRREKPA